jgi:hypothetical protein
MARARAMNQRRMKSFNYLLFGLLLVVTVLVSNFALVNPEVAERGIAAFLGLPRWAFPTLALTIGMVVFAVGLQSRADWPEALGAFLIAGSVMGAELIFGLDHFAWFGLAAVPYILPFTTFLVLLMIGLAKSR